MKLYTLRHRLIYLRHLWKSQYPKDKDGVGAALEKIPMVVKNIPKIERLIGNRSWTRHTCNECWEEVDKVIVFGESETKQICERCLKCAVAMITST